MRNQKIYNVLALGILLLLNGSCSENVDKDLENDLTWTYTYLKSQENRKDELKKTLLKNWFVMDSIAKAQGLINDYELIENMSETESTDWDFIVAVAYFTKGNYDDISEAFERIRESHKTVKIKGLTFDQVGKVVKSELVKKTK